MNKTSLAFATAGAACIALSLLLLRGGSEPGVTMRDFEAYYSAGATWLAHGDPYSGDLWNVQRTIPGVDASRYEVLPFVGVPATLLFWALFAYAPYERAVVAWGAVLAFALLTMVGLTATLLRLTRMQTALTFFIALAFVPITSGLALGQAAMPAYACALAAIVVPISMSPFMTALAALQPNVALGLGAFFFSWRSALALLASAAVLWGASALALGPSWLLPYIATLTAHGSAERFSAIQYTTVAVLYGFSIAPGVAVAVGLIVGALAAAFSVAGTMCARGVVRRFAILCCAVPFVAGFFHEHNFVALFVPVIVALLYTHRPWLATVATLLVGVNWLDFAQRPQGAPQDLALAAGLLCLCIALRPARQQAIAAGIIVALLACAAWIGTAHRVPIWPTDMSGVAAGDTIAAVWKSEQLQTGLLRPDAAAALLRSLALLGSALLLYLNIDIHHVVERRDRVGTEVL